MTRKRLPGNLNLSHHLTRLSDILWPVLSDPFGYDDDDYDYDDEDDYYYEDDFYDESESDYEDRMNFYMCAVVVCVPL